MNATQGPGRPADRREFLRHLRLPDLLTFMTVRQMGSLSGAARALAVTPSQVSKAIARLEAHLKVALVERTPSGVVLSQAGSRVARQLETVTMMLQDLSRDADQRLALAIHPSLTPVLAPLLAEALPTSRIAFVDHAPNDAALDRADIAGVLTLGTDLPHRSWPRMILGQIPIRVYAHPSLAAELAPVAALDRLQTIPFIHVAPAGQFGEIDSHPVPARQRQIGHTAQSLHLALSLAARSRQLVVANRLTARPYVNDGRLAEVRIGDWHSTCAASFSWSRHGLPDAPRERIVEVLREEISKCLGQ